MRRVLPSSLLLGALAGLAACGEPVLRVTDESYEPRIVVEGLLLAGSPVRDIHVTRNFPVDFDLSRTSIVLGDARVRLIDEGDGAVYPLTFHGDRDFKKAVFHDDGADLIVQPGGTYTLEVEARVENLSLATRATTTVPAPGFRIVDISHERLGYRPVGDDGEVIDIEVRIERSPGTTFYLLSAYALTASAETFVYDNPFTEEKPDELLLGDILDFRYNYGWIQNTPPTAGTSIMDLFWWDLWFYGRHRIVIYAADPNYASFLQTFDDVQEEDGNFHEPLFRLEGDGIGYFGSAIADTVFVEITR